MTVFGVRHRRFVFLCFGAVLSVRAMWKVRKAYPPGWLAYLYCFLVMCDGPGTSPTVLIFRLHLFYILSFVQSTAAGSDGYDQEFSAAGVLLSEITAYASRITFTTPATEKLRSLRPFKEKR